MNIALSIASYVVLWWVSFFVMLPIGARSPHEAGESVQSGLEPGAPKVHGLGKKALLAAGLAAILWLAGAWALPKGVWSLPH